MLIKTSDHLEGGLYLFTLGDSCHYALSSLLLPPGSQRSGISEEAAAAKGTPDSPAQATADKKSLSGLHESPHYKSESSPKTPALNNAPFVLFDPGSSAHVEHLIARLEKQGFNLKNLQCILPTHLHPERISGLPLLRARAPQALLVGSQSMKKALSDPAFVRELATQDAAIRASLGLVPSLIEEAAFGKSFIVDECISDSDVIAVGEETTVRANIQLGHSASSLSYFIQPHEYLICDETLGYYRGREIPAPAPDEDRALYRKALTQIAKLELRALCLPFSGVLTGELLPKHLQKLGSTLDDIELQFRQGIDAGLSAEVLRSALETQIFSSQSRDPVLRNAMARSMEALCRQLLATLPSG
jgi:glyoxylase-like metal-dependent hydrolase (beta-lactamase superfamily II)